jgi:asparagine synthase (glutamine-hydrolysing)
VCGLAGILAGRGAPAGVLLKQVETMAATLRHRGPDDAGSWCDEEAGIALGFRRLAILDLSPAGHQPMVSGSGRWVIAMNGEIYNFMEVRKVLDGQGVRFRGNSDTEVLLEAVDRWGVRRALQACAGMFGVAAWDRHQRELTLARDRLGIKPLLMGRAGRSLVFASEMRALVAHPELDRRVRPQAVAEYLRYLSVPEPGTILEDVSKLPPGTYITCRNPSALPEPEVYWSAGDAMRRPSQPGVSLPEMHEALDDAVRGHLRSDVPLGALLSGGIDSTLLVALAKRHVTQDLRTYTIAFDDPRHDESRYAAAVARHLGTEHTTIDLSNRDALGAVPTLVDLLDEPFANPSTLPAYLVAQAARSHVTVALAGDGGDEVFGGYTRMIRAPRLLRRLGAIPGPFRGPLATLLGAVQPGAFEVSATLVNRLLPRGSGVRLADEKAGKLAELLRQRTPAAMYRSLLTAGWPAPPVLDTGAVEGDAATDPVWTALQQVDGPPNLDDLFRLEQQHYLTYDLLHKVDRATMYAGLEGRVPFLDHRVVELSWMMPAQAHVSGGLGKQVLRSLLHRHVPPELVDRPKTGFTVPLGSWLRGPLRSRAEERLDPAVLAGAGLRADVIGPTWEKVRGGSDHEALAIWAVVTYVDWRERWLQPQPVAAAVHG